MSHRVMSCISCHLFAHIHPHMLLFFVNVYLNWPCDPSSISSRSWSPSALFITHWSQFRTRSSFSVRLIMLLTTNFSSTISSKFSVDKKHQLFLSILNFRSHIDGLLFTQPLITRFLYSLLKNSSAEFSFETEYGFDTLFKANGLANEKTLSPPIVSPSWEKVGVFQKEKTKLWITNRITK